MTDWHREHQKERAQGPRYQTLRIGLDPGPDKLRARILLRTQGWLAQGLREEVASFDAAFGPMRFPPLGYEQVLRHITGHETEGIDEESLIRELCQKTAQYARRQRIWFRSEPGITWFGEVSAVPMTLATQPSL